MLRLYGKHSCRLVRRDGAKIWWERSLASGLLPVHHLLRAARRLDLLRSWGSALLRASLRWATEAALLGLRWGEPISCFAFIPFNLSLARWCHTRNSLFYLKQSQVDQPLSPLLSSHLTFPSLQTVCNNMITFWLESHRQRSRLHWRERCSITARVLFLSCLVLSPTN